MRIYVRLAWAPSWDAFQKVFQHNLLGGASLKGKVKLVASSSVPPFWWVIDLADNELSQKLLSRDDKGFGATVVYPYLDPAPEVDCRQPKVEGEKVKCPQEKEEAVVGVVPEDLTITNEMVAGWRSDILDVGTYAGEAEAALLATRLSQLAERQVGFHVCETLGEAGLLRYVHSFGPDVDLWLLYGDHHYRVVERDPDGQLLMVRYRSDGDLDILGRFRHHAIETRVDGSCLIDACHIAVYNKSALDREVRDHRRWISEQMPEASVRLLLAAMAYDLAEGIPVHGPGKKTHKLLAPFEGLGVSQEKKPRRFVGTGHTELSANASHRVLAAAERLRGPIRLTFPESAQKVSLGGKRVARSLLGIASDAMRDDDLVLGELAGEGAWLITLQCPHCKATASLRVVLEKEHALQSMELEVFLGPEFTFTSVAMREATRKMATTIAEKQRISLQEAAEKVTETSANASKREAWREILKKTPIKGTVIEKTTCKGYDAFKVTFTEAGWWFQVTLDPSCLEVQTSPMSLQDFKNRRALITNHVFTPALRSTKDGGLELESHRDGGGGHMHLGILRTFGRDALLFRNFFVDLCNHPLLLWGLDDDTLNAPQICEYDQEVQGEVAAILNELDERFKSSNPFLGQELIVTFAQQLVERVYKLHNNGGFAEGVSAHYQALNVERVLSQPEKSRTLEVRRMRAQRSVDEFIAVGEMFQARIRWLKKTYPKATVPFEPREPVTAPEKTEIQQEVMFYLSECGAPNSSAIIGMVNANIDERPG